MKFNVVELPYKFKSIENKGLSNDLFILNELFFVKCSKSVTDLFLNKENQISVIDLIRNKNFTLPILETKIEEEKLWVLMPYYQELTTLEKYEINDEILQQLSNLVKKLHTIEITNSKVIKWDPLVQLDLYCSLIDDKKSIKVFKNELESFFNMYQPQRIVLCHNDLIANNFVLKDSWYLIDWDFACLNDYLFDVASFVSETLQEKENQQLINSWYQLFKLTEKELIVIDYWIKYQNLIWYCWATYLYNKTKEKIYQLIADNKMEMLK